MTNLSYLARGVILAFLFGSFGGHSLQASYRTQREVRTNTLKCFLLVTTSAALAVGHGLLNNWCSNELKRVPFYKAPLHEWLTAFAAFVLHVKLYSKLEERLTIPPSVALPTYALGLGLLQHLAEGYPLGNRAWRAPISPNGFKAMNLLVSNSFLFTGGIFSVLLISELTADLINKIL